jgi:hypothetical protein
LSLSRGHKTHSSSLFRPIFAWFSWFPRAASFCFRQANYQLICNQQTSSKLASELGTRLPAELVGLTLCSMSGQALSRYFSATKTTALECPLALANPGKLPYLDSQGSSRTT